MCVRCTNSCFLFQRWKLMSCRMKMEQLKEAVAWGNEEVKSGELCVSSPAELS